ncbi:MAG: maleylpyruvate isomerase N-terminal domain-containing protein [Dietzia sp.]
MTENPLPHAHLIALDAATELFGRAVADGLDGDCDSCPGWSRRDCANHVLGGGLRYAAYFPRLPESEIGWTRTADHAGDDPVGALSRTSAELRDRLASAPDADAPVAHRLAEIPVRDLLALRVFELVLHAHDLQPRSWESDVAEVLADWLLENARDVVELMRTFGVLAPALPVGTDAGARARLLALAGRAPAP